MNEAPARGHFRLNVAFTLVLAVMAAHESEHVAQVLQKDGTIENCPNDCRGVLGFVFDVEWIHFLYNTSIFFALAALFVGYRMWEARWRQASMVSWLLLTVGIFVVQGYHVVEHVVKLDQWLGNGHQSPTPGLLGQLLSSPDERNFSLIELHFLFNTVVFVCVVGGYFGFRIYRHLGIQPRLRWLPAATVVVPLVAAGGIAWAAQVPIVRLSAGVHQGPLVIDHAQKLVGEPGAIVRGGIVITANDVSVRELTVVGGEHGVQVFGAKRVLLDDVTVSGAMLDGINVRRSSVVIRDCVVRSLRSPYAQGIDISFVFDLPPSVVEDCRITGGQEGIAVNSARVMLRGNRVSRTTLRGITVSEMSMGMVQENDVSDSLGVGIFCGDYAHCRIDGNRVAGTRRDQASEDLTRAGIGILAHYGAVADVGENELRSNGRGTAAFFGAKLKTRG